MTKKWVYLFSEGNKEMRNLLGGKGAGLAEMTNAGLPVPPGFTITTEACNAYFDAGKEFPAGMWEQTLEALKVVEAQTGKRYGDPANPLLVSCRSGARVSMPGMMDTVLNIGLNPQTLAGMVRLTGNERFAWDSYRRLIQMFGNTVKGVDRQKFEHALEHLRERVGVKTDADLTTDQLKEVVALFKAIYKDALGEDFPDDVYEQMKQATAAVFHSWFGRPAMEYRNFNKLPHNWGTAVNICTMVFGNMGDDSATGVAFTRNPATGEKHVYGESLINAQGEDVVAGIRTPHPIDDMSREMPKSYDEFLQICDMLERHYRDIQDMEFTVERGKLWMLQTRAGKRTAAAAVKVAVDLANEGIITQQEAIMRVEPSQVVQLLLPRFDPQDQDAARKAGRLVAKGLNASPGAAVGHAILDADRAEAQASKDYPVILVRPETNPDDVHGMLVAKGVLTQRGGATSHAAVVARGLGLPCVSGCEELRIDLEAHTFAARGQTVKEGDLISIDGTTGEVFTGAINKVDPNFDEEVDLKTLLGWADEIKRLGVWANADYPRDALRARAFGAQGIGLCRTEHMFFEQERLPIVQQMILAKEDATRQAALDQLLPFQRGDFEGIFRAMDGYPVIIRLIDPPLHEFLPSFEELLVKVTELRTRGATGPELHETETMLKAVESMREMNPMLGLRGIRLGIMLPGLIAMQVRAIMEAACNVTLEGKVVHPEIMIPLVGHVNELSVVEKALRPLAEQVCRDKGVNVHYKFGTMIEVPRAALTAGDIAKEAEFFSFGTNDLSQTTYGYSRDDAEGKFLLKYVEDKILPTNPFQQLDRDGVGRLMRMAVSEGRAARPGLEVGICGEHGGDPSSIEFCHMIGLNYVSCSPFRVPVARLAAAQAALGTEIFRDK